MTITKTRIKHQIVAEGALLTLDKHYASHDNMCFMVDLVANGELWHRSAFNTFDEALDAYYNVMDKKEVIRGDQ